jgi:hypothetical protein
MKRSNHSKTTYIVRIYRNDNIEPHKIVGIIEEIGGEEKRIFLTIEDLFEILTKREK